MMPSTLKPPTFAPSCADSGAASLVYALEESGVSSYLAYPADVLVAVLLGEAEVLVQAEADVVAVQAVGGVAEVEQVLLKSGGDGRLARGRQTGEPEGEALLLAVLAALLASETGVPGDVAVKQTAMLAYVCYSRLRAIV